MITDNVNFKQQVNKLVEKGYTVEHMDNNGASLKAPKRTRLQTKIGYGVGLCVIWFVPILGIIILAAAFIDQILAKQETVYIAR